MTRGTLVVLTVLLAGILFLMPGTTISREMVDPGGTDTRVTSEPPDANDILNQTNPEDLQGTITPEQKAPEEPKKKKLKKLKKVIQGTVEVDSTLRIRDGPWGNIIGGFKNGAKVEIVGEEGDFYKIRYKGGFAFIHKNYVSTSDQRASQEPAYPPSSKEDPPKTPATPKTPKEELPPSSGATGDTVGQKYGDGTAKGAVNWALDQMDGGTQNGYNDNNGMRTKDSPAAWNNWCLAFVSRAWGTKVPDLRAGSAILAYNQCKASGRIVNDRDPPAGAPLFQDATTSNSWGHIFIATGEKTSSGDPIIITTGWPGYNGIHRITLSEMESKYHAKYLGWARVP